MNFEKIPQRNIDEVESKLTVDAESEQENGVVNLPQTSETLNELKQEEAKKTSEELQEVREKIENVGNSKSSEPKLSRRAFLAGVGATLASPGISKAAEVSDFVAEKMNNSKNETIVEDRNLEKEFHIIDVPEDFKLQSELELDIRRNFINPSGVNKVNKYEEDAILQMVYESGRDEFANLINVFEKKSPFFGKKNRADILAMSGHSFQPSMSGGRREQNKKLYNMLDNVRDGGEKFDKLATLLRENGYDKNIDFYSWSQKRMDQLMTDEQERKAFIELQKVGLDASTYFKTEFGVDYSNKDISSKDKIKALEKHGYFKMTKKERQSYTNKLYDKLKNNT